MFTIKNLLKASAICCMAAIIMIVGCKKTPIGYISSNMYYSLNPFTAHQGITTVSTGLVADGSTAPINVKLLAIRDLATGKDASKIFLTTDTILVYKSAVTSSDSTLALLNAKLKDSTLAPFSVNPVGGRLQFTSASKYLPLGQYTIDVQASNIKGTRTINNACTINVVSALTDTLFYTAYSHSNNDFSIFVPEPASLLNIKVTYIATGPNKIIFVWKDKNGAYFNPANNEVQNRSARPVWKDWDPYYTQIKTDTSIEYGYPRGVPQFPIFQSAATYPGFGTGIVYYMIAGAHTDNGLNSNTTFQPLFYQTQGTYIVDINVTDVTRVP